MLLHHDAGGVQADVEVVERTSYSRSFVYDLLDRGMLPSVACGRTRMVREADLDAFIRRLAEPVAA